MIVITITHISNGYKAEVAAIGYEVGATRNAALYNLMCTLGMFGYPEGMENYEVRDAR